ncbi:MAG: hypothetical protein ACXVVU_24305 [Solirubrobacteraceae bacterium]
MRRRAVFVAVAATGAAACAAVASADFVIPTRTEPGPNTRIAADALNGAIAAVGNGDPSCRPHMVRGGATTTHDPPPQDMLDAFAVLRRPATSGDAFENKLRIPFGGPIAVDYIRRARVLPDGTSIYVVPSMSARPMIAKRPASCSAREREALEHRLRGKPAQAQRAARRLLRNYERGQREAASSPPTPGILVFEFGPHGGGGGGGGQDVAGIRKRGAYTSTYAGRRRGTRLVGLIPDGVAAIEFTFARGRGLGPEGDRVYRTIYRRTAAVVDNVVALTVPRMPEDAFFNRQVWRAADGSVVNTVKPPF